MNYEHFAAAIEHKYGCCADIGVKKILDDDGNVTGHEFEITRWDEAIAGEPQPPDTVLEADLLDYVVTVLPTVQADAAEVHELQKVEHLFKRTMIKALSEINQSDNTIFSAQTKQNVQTLRALLRD